MFRRYGDDCIRRLPVALDECDKEANAWTSEMKFNGYRVHAERKDGQWLFWSRRWKKHPLGPKMLALAIAELEEWSKGREFGDGTMLDGEWLERRTEIAEGLIFWDVLLLNGEWQGDKPYRERMLALGGLTSLWNDGFRVEDLGSLKEPFFSVVQRNWSDHKAYYARATQIPWVEGLVLKRLDSKLIGSTKDRAINPSWIKVKYKGSSTGEKVGVQT